MKKLSVITPNYNHARYLPEMLDAILSQSVQPEEFIIVDDASTDNSVEILKRYAERYPIIKLVCGAENKGVNHFYRSGRGSEIRSLFLSCVVILL